jgi:hypothetical protein
MADEEAAGKLETYRRRAEELRRVAEGLKNHDARETILRIAAAYGHMADMLERFPGMFEPPPQERDQNEDTLKPH